MHVDLLIGVDHLELHTSLGEVRGVANEPIARLTPLGWTCIGPSTPTAQPRVFTGCMQTFFRQRRDTSLNDLVRQMWQVDSQDHMVQPCAPLTKPESEALTKVQQSCKMVNGRYEVGLQWKTESTTLPDSYPTALR